MQTRNKATQMRDAGVEPEVDVFPRIKREYVERMKNYRDPDQLNAPLAKLREITRTQTRTQTQM